MEEAIICTNVWSLSRESKLAFQQLNSFIIYLLYTCMTVEEGEKNEDNFCYFVFRYLHDLCPNVFMENQFLHKHKECCSACFWQQFINANVMKTWIFVITNPGHVSSF